MDQLQLLLKKRIDELKTIIEKAETCIAKSPDGSLHIVKNQNTDLYYLRTEAKDTHGKYIRKSQTKLIGQLAQKDYAKKVYSKAKIQQLQLEKCLDKYHPDELYSVYDRLSESKRSLVKPYILSEEAFIKQWKERKLELKTMYGKDDLAMIPEEDSIITEQGEKVRSKSEKILADKLYLMKIPYVYECPLNMIGYGYIKPDFTVLNSRTKREFVWEHLGLMDDREYCEKAIKKIELYQKNGIYPGRGLILTYETTTHPLSSKVIEGLIEEFLR
ncbi:MAG: hypothetical protein PUC65_07830 [Clostridiales bacterium]|nr:hypothetical protein [Clostridiales bacterium]